MREKSMPPKHTCLGSSPSNNGGPTQILKHLWLGNREDAMNYDKLKKLSISVVVNATEQLPNFHPDQMKYMKINIKDKETTDLRPHFAGVTQFIANAIDNGESVLVHCVAGASRSASFVICYMMSKLGEQISLLDAFRWCKARRSCVQPNKMFLVQLAEIEIYFHNGCSSVAKRKEKLWTSFEMNELRREKVKGHLKSGMNVSLSPCVIM
ncbi:hypothetical protein ScalyP_jg9839 [Parmales sp. scaly parma]|nr:hypothetical protein ScalyP_jg9839 [Parmales sp. scaly parma]